MKSTLQLSAGTIDYVDTGGNGPAVLLLHGLLMDWTLWDAVVADLSVDHRCIAPTLPLGGHTRPIGGNDLSLPGVATLTRELIDRLNLEDVTVVGNDTGGALVQLLAANNPDRIDRIALVSCDAFENYPPGLTGETLVLAGKLPPSLFGLFMQQLRLKPIRRLPIAFGWLTKRGDRQTARWLGPLLHQREVRRDTVNILRSIAAERDLLEETAPALANFTRPALIVWASEDRVMPVEHGQRLADLLPDSRLVEIADSHTLIPLDQPAALADTLRRFIHDTPSQDGSAAHATTARQPGGTRPAGPRQQRTHDGRAT
jgi:pimeloyl-ACP methyl ester carboxylesterase